MVVRVCADNPLLDPSLVDQLIRFCQKQHPACDYAAFSKNLPLGFGCEVFSFAALKEAFENACLPEEREHVTPFFYRHPAQFGVKYLDYPEDLSHYRLTVDTPDDFRVVQTLIEALYPDNPQFTLEHVITQLERQPKLALYNAHVQQKSI
jgi:spore coat polysaccharide biosynthesis protein SpsF